jgi:signal transduction histidine kinase
VSVRESTAELRSRLGHDLNTPLAVIIGYGELVGTRDDAETRVEASRMIVQAAERLSREIDTTLDLLLPASGPVLQTAPVTQLTDAAVDE